MVQTLRWLRTAVSAEAVLCSVQVVLVLVLLMPFSMSSLPRMFSSPYVMLRLWLPMLLTICH